jgi:mono/diheme cytochrome c family protein
MRRTIETDDPRSPRRVRVAWAFTAVALLGIASDPLTAGPDEASAGRQADKVFEANVRPFLVRNCVECHGAKGAKGKFRLDRLSATFAAGDRERWLAALKRVQAGEMPPEGKPRPSSAEVRAFSEWVAAKAAAADRSQGRVVLRRLNRTEYENTVRDLLGIEVDLKEQLPLDTSSNGFDNVGDALHTSSFLMDRYLEAADKSLNLAIANRPRPPLLKKRYSLKDEHAFRLSTERVYRREGDTVVMFSSSDWNAITVGQFYPADRGRYRIRISATAIQSEKKPVTYRIDAGPMLMGTTNHLVGYFDAAPDKPTLLEFVDHFEARNHIRLHPYGLASAQAVDKIGADKYRGPGLAVHWVDVEGPLHDAWPPKSHRRIFGDLKQGAVPGAGDRDRVEVLSKNPEEDARRILREFVRRAYRRSVTETDIEPFVELVKEKLARKSTFEQAVRVGLAAVMVSPEFLFLREKPGRLDDFALASRLSYFLWSTMPDEELLALAGKKELGRPETLRRQVERLLAHPKAAAFTENFLGQWLELRNIDATAPDHRLYPEFDEMLKTAMVQETRLFFDELLKHDLGLTNVIDSDFTMLNERLAKHYGIGGVTGHRFRKVKLPPGSHRGGVLTMASVLKVTANGTNTSPITRGAWVLDRILGTPPSPPPPGIAALEPDIRGATTIRQQLAKHRETASCATCHVKIDPPGFALESFDVIGGWREFYRSVGNGKPVTIDSKRMHYYRGPDVDPADVLPDGRRFANIDEFKRLLLKDKDRIARAFVGQLTTYATGGVPRPGDRAEIEAIVAKARGKDYGVRTLVHEVVQSKLFRNK